MRTKEEKTAYERERSRKRRARNKLAGIPRERNPEKHRARSKKYQQAHPDRVAASHSKYYRANPDKALTWKRRARHPRRKMHLAC